MGRIYVGVSGWVYPDWAGIVYPARTPRRFDALSCLARYFDALEVNSSFYRPPSPRTTESWIRRVPDAGRFVFTFKLHRRFTHERADYSSQEVTLYKEGLAPAATAGMLGAVLMQFPWSFRCGPDAYEWLLRLRDDFGEYPLVLEVRHSSWDRPEVLERLRELGINFCNIDQPPLSNCLRPTSYATGPIGYVRLHGRRCDAWFAENENPHERYNYLYSPEELARWAGRIGRLAGQTEKVFAFTNNCHSGQSVANALQLRFLLERRRVDLPPELPARYPFLREIGDPACPSMDPSDEPTLFEPRSPPSSQGDANRAGG